MELYLFGRTLLLLLVLIAQVNAKCDIFESRRADLLRIQQLDHQRSTPFTPIMGNRKHTPVFTITGTEATVTVGTGTVTGDTSLVHPTNRAATHFISTIYVVNQDNIIIAMNLLSGTTSQPSLTFQIPRETTSIQAFSFCNNHGLHGSEVSQVTATGTALAACAVIPCYEDTIGIENGVCVQFTVMEADAMRRQLSEHKQEKPFVPATSNFKHTPYVTITGTSAKVTVGLGTTSGNAADPIHPSVSSEDPLVVHYIEMLFVKDQTGKIIAASYLPATKFPPTLEFLIPSGTTSLTAFSMCNTHGLFQSSIVSVPSSSQGSGSLVCGVAECGGVEVINQLDHDDL